MSESNAKRMFSTQNMSLVRFGQICEFLQIDFGDVAKFAVQPNHDLPRQVSRDVEETLVRRPDLLAVFYLLLKRWSFREIAKRLGIGELEIQRLMLRLDEMRLIELQASNRYRLLVSPSLRWRKHGPVREYFLKKVAAEFLTEPADDTGANQIFISGEVSPETWKRILSSLEKAALEAERSMEADALLPKGKTNSIGILVAARPYVLTDLFGPPSKRRKPS